jgi:ABC-2 type transport system permease protein
MIELLERYLILVVFRRGRRGNGWSSVIKFWRIFWFEYSRRVFTRRFLVTVLWIPFSLVAALIGMVMLFLIRTDFSPVGYMDRSGILAFPVVDGSNGYRQSAWKYIAFPDEDQAQQALEAGQIQAYFVVPQDYLQSGRVRLVSFHPPGVLAISDFKEFLTAQLLNDEEPAARQRIISGSKMSVISADGSREYSRSKAINMLLPTFLGLLFMYAINNTGGFLLNAIALERQNDTIEIVATSVSGSQLIAGKALGSMAAGASQFAGIGGMGAGVLLLTRLAFPEFVKISVSAEMVLILAGLFIPAFIMYSALLVAAGVVFEESAVSLAFGILYLPLLLPYFLIQTIAESPNSALAVGMSLFPLTASLAMPFRYTYTLVPAWELAASILTLVTCAILSIWAMGKAVRRGLFEPVIKFPLRKWVQKWREKRGGHV